jgi:hypothetical protein
LGRGERELELTPVIKDRATRHRGQH